MDYFSTAYKEAKLLSHDLSEKILGVTWQKHILKTKVLTWPSLPSIYTILMQSQLCWADHIVHMKNRRLLKKLLYGKQSQNKRSQGGKKMCFKDTLEFSMKSFSVTPNCLEYLVQDRDKSRKAVRCGAKVCEARRNATTELHRKLRKGAAIYVTAATIPCSHCPTLFRTKIGLINPNPAERHNLLCCLIHLAPISCGPHRAHIRLASTSSKSRLSLSGV